MGNITSCDGDSEYSVVATPTDTTEGKTISVKGEVQYSNDTNRKQHEVIQQEQEFLKVHLSEMKKRCIVSTPDLIQAHVEQVEELVRRNKVIQSMISENNQNNNLNDTDNDDSTMSDVDADPTYDDDDDDDDLDDFDNMGDDSKSYDGNKSVSSFARISSYFAATVVSAATQKAGSSGKNRTKQRYGNNNMTPSISSRSRTSRRGNHRHSNNDFRRSNSIAAAKNRYKQQPRIVGGMEFVESETTRKKIQMIITEFYHQSWIQRNLYTALLSTASPTVIALSSSLSSATTAAGRTLLTCHNPILNKKDNARSSSYATSSSIEFIQQVEMYSSVLHLRMKMKCYNYYQLHLLRRKLNHSYTKGIQNSIQALTTYTPQSFQRQLQQRKQEIRLQQGYDLNLKRHHHHKGRGASSTCSRGSKNKFVIPNLPLLISSSDESGSDTQNDEQEQLHFGIGPPSHPVQLLVTNSVFMDLAVTGSLGFNPMKRRISAAYVDRKLLLSPTQHLVVLNRRSGVPIAVCTLLTPITSSFPVVRMYTTKPRVWNQVRTTTTGKLGLTWTESLPLYTWAEFVTETIDPSSPDVPIPISYSIYYISDNGGDGTTLEPSPKFRATQEFPSTASTTTEGGASYCTPILKITGRTSREFHSSGCATLSMCTDTNTSHNATAATTNCKSGAYWKLSISQGIDPSVFICFTSFIDELMERTMRLLCQQMKEQKLEC